jgi:hypothetical protein
MQRLPAVALKPDAKVNEVKVNRDKVGQAIQMKLIPYAV